MTSIADFAYLITAMSSSSSSDNKLLLKTIILEALAEAKKEYQQDPMRLFGLLFPKTRPTQSKHGADVRGLTFYHASPKRFRHGDVLRGNMSGGYGSEHENVCMTTTPKPHGTIQSAIQDDWFVYEVEPVGPVWFVEINKEYQAHQAVVKSLVGRAGALNKNHPSPSRQRAKSPAVEKQRQKKWEDRLEKRLTKLDQVGSDDNES
ncbi:MAG: hypothetical protein E6R04_05805 [Spirochaetes bacterium]|nr:MAG: hypothetical protein E6R04_05805 [Spirochaetota bacterium]